MKCQMLLLLMCLGVAQINFGMGNQPGIRFRPSAQEEKRNELANSFKFLIPMYFLIYLSGEKLNSFLGLEPPIPLRIAGAPTGIVIGQWWSSKVNFQPKKHIPAALTGAFLYFVALEWLSNLHAQLTTS